MKKVFNRLCIATILMSALLSTACQKESNNPPVTNVPSLLTTKTWQIDEVTDYASGTPDKQYKRGATNNKEDYSMIRQKFNTNGTISYTDQFGVTDNNGTWELLDNNSKIKLGLPSLGLSVTCDDLVVTANAFSYKLKYAYSDYTLFTFVPVP